MSNRGGGVAYGIDSEVQAEFVSRYRQGLVSGNSMSLTMFGMLFIIYAVWCFRTSSAKHSEKPWGHPGAAHFAAWCCHHIAWACGLTFTVRWDGDSQGCDDRNRGVVAAVGPHGIFPLAMQAFLPRAHPPRLSRLPVVRFRSRTAASGS